jgi:curli biogenesis system outer membrane secretion channel CsgG
VKYILKKSFFKTILFIIILPLSIGCSTTKDVTHPSEETASPSEPPTKKEDYEGPKVKVVVRKFIDASSNLKNSGQTEEGVAEMLGSALSATNRFIVQISLLETKQPIKGADLLIEGTITQFEPGKGLIIKTESHVTFLLKVSDIKTGRKLISQNIEGNATPMEKAIKMAIEESAKLIVAKTPSEYYRVPSSPPSPKESIKSPKTQPEKTSSPPTPPVVKSGPPLRVIQVIWSNVNLREGPGTNYKKVGSIKQGTSMELLEDKGNWLRVRLQNGNEVWVSKQATTLAPKTTPPSSSIPAPPSTGVKPNPM